MLVTTNVLGICSVLFISENKIFHKILMYLLYICKCYTIFKKINSLKHIIKFENAIKKISKQKIYSEIIVPKQLLKLQIHFGYIKYLFS
jgi:uncharacterized membrane protein YesL